MVRTSVFPTLLQEKELRLFKEKIDAETIMPAGRMLFWPATDDSVQSVPHQQFARRPNLPKLLSPQTVNEHDCRCSSRAFLALRMCGPMVRTSGFGVQD